MTKVEKCQRGYRQVERRWRVEGSVHTALGVRSRNVEPGCRPGVWYDWPRDDLQALNAENTDWWYLCDIEKLAGVL